jgi:hypothetical protein
MHKICMHVWKYLRYHLSQFLEKLKHRIIRLNIRLKTRIIKIFILREIIEMKGIKLTDSSYFFIFFYDSCIYDLTIKFGDEANSKLK